MPEIDKGRAHDIAEAEGYDLCVVVTAHAESDTVDTDIGYANDAMCYEDVIGYLLAAVSSIGNECFGPVTAQLVDVNGKVLITGEASGSSSLN